VPNQAIHYSSAVLTNAAESAANTETVVCTLAGVLSRWPGQLFIIEGWVQITPGAAATAGQVRVRRGGLTGTLIGPNTAVTNVTAAKVNQLEIFAEDQPGEGQFTYVVTFQGTGEGGAATFQNAEVICTVN
jgi:hypothetical protein